MSPSSPTDDVSPLVVHDNGYVVDGGSLAVSGAMVGEFLAAVLDRRASFRFTARGSSMSPFIRDQDVVTVSPRSARPLRAGDVVAFRLSAGDSLFVHRIVAGADDRYLLRGDNAESADGFVPAGDVLGVVTRVERRGRQARMAIGPPARLLAALSRRGWLRPCLGVARRVLRPLTHGSRA